MAESVRERIRKTQEALKKGLEKPFKDLDGILEAMEKELDTYEAASEEDARLIQLLKKEILVLRQLRDPPNTYAYFFRLISDASEAVDEETGEKRKKLATAEVVAEGDGRGQHFLVNVDLTIDAKSLKFGQRLLVLSGANHVIRALPEFTGSGQAGTVENIFPDGRVSVRTALEEVQFLFVASGVPADKLVAGSRVLYSPETKFVFNVIQEERRSALQMEEVKPVTYDQIGGLDEQVREFEENIVLPRIRPELFADYHVTLPKGVVLHGPPGCGKTLVARAMAHRIKTMGREVAFFFGNGPEFLIKWVGDSEQKLREPAEYAKTHPQVIVLYVLDEADAIIRTRGSFGGHAGVNDSLVTQINSILDGFVAIPNLIFVGITNRLDLLDSAVLRPGRLDLHLKVPRPARKNAEKILRIYLPDGIPLHPKYFDTVHPDYNKSVYNAFDGKPTRVLDYFVRQVIDHIYGDDGADEKVIAKRQRVAIVRFQSGEHRVLSMKDFVSGALLQNIANKAKIAAALAARDGGEKGLRLKHLHDQVDMNFRRIRDQINQSQEWVRMEGLSLDAHFDVLPDEAGAEGRV